MSDTDRAGGSDTGRISLLAAVGTNLLIAVAKVGAFLATGSTALLAEAAHSVADTSKQILLFVGRHRARREADPEHPFGYGPERYFWALIVAIVLFPLGGAYALVEAVGAWRAPEPIMSPAWAIGVLVAAFVFEGSSFLVALRESRRDDPDSNPWQYIRKTRNPDVAFVLVEDTGALVGVALALIGVLASEITGDPRWDALGGAAVGMLMFGIAWVLVTETRSLMVGEAATPEEQEELRAVIESSPSVIRLIYVRTLQLAPDQLLVAAKLELEPDLSFPEVVELIDVIEDRVYEAMPTVSVLHIEPDRYEPEERPAPPWESES